MLPPTYDEYLRDTHHPHLSGSTHAAILATTNADTHTGTLSIYTYRPSLLPLVSLGLPLSLSLSPSEHAASRHQVLVSTSSHAATHDVSITTTILPLSPL
ncbi:hypothetical protein Pcinc_031868, partial [Petrolisthes cinctipes]